MNGWWPYLEERTRREIDAHVLRDRRLMAVKAVWEALSPLELGPHAAEQVVHARYEALGDRVHFSPPDPLDVPALAARAAALPGPVAAIEALWDGDTVHDWFVLLVAVLDHPAGEARLATVHHRPGGPAPGTTAAEAGRSLADSLRVPFHFASPDTPDDEAPRWRTVPRIHSLSMSSVQTTAASGEPNCS
ncbi:hypothetical protein [Streptomyces rimosus]|uniref:hypothetical protein n=1 Tax=Streptomyces rimosus TaxID=1927 RepID=UPI000AB095A1|nr:hypothetical protein [Streptomyces rimosus]